MGVSGSSQLDAPRLCLFIDLKNALFANELKRFPTFLVYFHSYTETICVLVPGKSTYVKPS